MNGVAESLDVEIVVMKLDEKRKRDGRGGFTLVELIVVLVILGILAAIMVPALLGWIDKAREKKYLLEARNVVLATQTVATGEYAAGKFTGNATLFINEHKEEIFDIADITGGGSNDIREMEFQNDGDGNRIAIVKRLTYRTSDNMIIVYDIAESPVYQIGEEIGAPVYDSSWPEIITNYIKDNDLTYKGTSTMRKAVKEAHGGKFPELTAGEKKILNSTSDLIQNLKNVDQLTWKPVEVNSAKNNFVLIANESDSESNINAYMVYYDGNYYACLNKVGDKYKFDNNPVDNKLFVGDLENAQSLSYYEKNLNKVVGKTWVKL